MLVMLVTAARDADADADAGPSTVCEKTKHGHGNAVYVCACPVDDTLRWSGGCEGGWTWILELPSVL